MAQTQQGMTEVKAPDAVSIVLPPSDGTYMYVAVKGSLHAVDCSVFGLSTDEKTALTKRFPGSSVEVINGILVKGSILGVINSLGELGYRVITTTGEAEITWTLEREL